jgi:hypothetical protein
MEKDRNHSASNSSPSKKLELSTPVSERLGASGASGTEALLNTNLAPSDDKGNMDRVRDLLFGGRLRDLEKKIDSLQETFAQQLGNLKSEMKSRFDETEVRHAQLVEKWMRSGNEAAQMHKNHVEALNESKKEFSDLLAQNTKSQRAQMESEMTLLAEQLNHLGQALEAKKLDVRKLSALLANMALDLDENH